MGGPTSGSGSGAGIGKQQIRRVAIGVAGLAVIGAGAFLITEHLTGDSGSGTPEAGTPVVVPPSSAEPTPSSAGEATALEVPATPSTTPTSTQPTPKSAQQKQDDVQGTALKNQKYQVFRAQPQTGAWAPPSELHQSQVKIGADTIVVTSAPLDLTGQHELSWVADAGVEHGDADCTNRIRVTQGAPVMTKPTLLLCWHTSESRSVYSVAMNPTGQPSWQASVAQIDKEWERLSTHQ